MYEFLKYDNAHFLECRYIFCEDNNFHCQRGKAKPLMYLFNVYE